MIWGWLVDCWWLILRALEEVCDEIYSLPLIPLVQLQGRWAWLKIKHIPKVPLVEVRLRQVIPWVYVLFTDIFNQAHLPPNEAISVSYDQDAFWPVHVLRWSCIFNIVELVWPIPGLKSSGTTSRLHALEPYSAEMRSWLPRTWIPWDSWTRSWRLFSVDSAME